MSDEVRAMAAIPVSAAWRIAHEYGYDQVVIIARRVGGAPEPHGEHVTTYGRGPAHAAVAARVGDFLKSRVMGWTDQQSPSIPEGFALVPRKCTPSQCEAMAVFARAMLDAASKIDCAPLYECGVLAFENERDAAAARAQDATSSGGEAAPGANPARTL